jgi:hypothetical protein
MRDGIGYGFDCPERLFGSTDIGLFRGGGPMFARATIPGGFLLILIAGCGQAPEGPPLAPVSGRVTLDGKPEPNAYVTFQPVTGSRKLDEEPGPQSHAVTDEEGRFVLRTVFGDRPGAMIGTHKVNVRVGIDLPPPLLPPRCRQEIDTFTVTTEGDDQVELRLFTIAEGSDQEVSLFRRKLR